MTAALLKLVTNEKPIQEMDRDAYSWLRLRAASALARLGSVGEKNAVHDAIVKLAADRQIARRSLCGRRPAGKARPTRT